MGKFGKKIQIDLNPLSYSLCLLGESGIGKSTIAKQICQKLAGDEGYISLDIGKEDGHKTISGIISEKCKTWEKYNEVIEDITENKFTDYPNLKMVVMDTFDQLCDLAEKETIREWNQKCREKGKPQVITINEAFGGYMKGQDHADDLILESWQKLKDVGVQVFVISHIKRTDISDVMSGESYSMLTASTTQRHFNAIKQKIDIVGMAYIDRTMVKIQTANKDKDGKAIFKNKITSESRVINFRDDTYSVDSKSRFADIIDQIPFDADEFIKAIKDAMLKEQAKDGISLEEAEKAQVIKEKVKEEKAKAASEQIKEDKANAKAEESREELLDAIQKGFINATDEQKAKIKEIVSKSGLTKLTDPNMPIDILIKIKELF